MAVDMLVDSGKLDACCAAEAAAIIAKGGGTAPLAYDFANNKGFADAIEAIPSGGSPLLTYKVITDIGTYNASDDNVDGYSRVSVNIVLQNFYTGSSDPQASFGNDGDLFLVV